MVSLFLISKVIRISTEKVSYGYKKMWAIPIDSDFTGNMKTVRSDLLP
jgi:hypothetical protein